MSGEKRQLFMKDPDVLDALSVAKSRIEKRFGGKVLTGVAMRLVLAEWLAICEK